MSAPASNQGPSPAEPLLGGDGGHTLRATLAGARIDPVFEDVAGIVRPLLLPAAVEVLGRKSWWPTSRHARPTPERAGPPSEAPTAVAPGTPPAGSPS